MKMYSENTLYDMYKGGWSKGYDRGLKIGIGLSFAVWVLIYGWRIFI